MEFFIPKMVNLSSGCCPVAGLWPATSKIILVMSQDHKQCLIDILGIPFWFCSQKRHTLWGYPQSTIFSDFIKEVYVNGLMVYLAVRVLSGGLKLVSGL